MFYKDNKLDVLLISVGLAYLIRDNWGKSG